MKVSDFIEQAGRPIAYYPLFAKVLKSTVAAIYLCQLSYWKGKEKKDGWIYKSQKEMEEETALTRSEQLTARRILKTAEILEEKLAGVPATLHFKINTDKLNEIVEDYLEQKERSSLQETCKLDCTKPANKNEENVQTIQRLPESTSKEYNNKEFAVEFENSKDEKIIFTWPEVQKLCNETGETKELVVERLELALKKADTGDKIKNIKGWALSAIKKGWDLAVNEQPGEGAEVEYQASKERNEREAKSTKADIETIKKAALNNPDAQKFFSMVDKIVSKPSIDEMVQTENLERKQELNKQRIEVLTKEIKVPVPA